MSRKLDVQQCNKFLSNPLKQNSRTVAGQGLHGCRGWARWICDQAAVVGEVEKWGALVWLRFPLRVVNPKFKVMRSWMRICKRMNINVSFVTSGVSGELLHFFCIYFCTYSCYLTCNWTEFWCNFEPVPSAKYIWDADLHVPCPLGS